MTKEKKVHFRIDTVGLLTEIVECGLKENSGVLKIPINLFIKHLELVAQRAIELDDPKLNILMLELALYDVKPKDILKAIEIQKKRIKSKPIKST